MKEIPILILSLVAGHTSWAVTVILDSFDTDQSVPTLTSPDTSVGSTLDAFSPAGPFQRMINLSASFGHFGTADAAVSGGLLSYTSSNLFSSNNPTVSVDYIPVPLQGIDWSIYDSIEFDIGSLAVGTSWSLVLQLSDTLNNGEQELISSIASSGTQTIVFSDFGVVDLSTLDFVNVNLKGTSGSNFAAELTEIRLVQAIPEPRLYGLAFGIAVVLFGSVFRLRGQRTR